MAVVGLGTEGEEEEAAANPLCLSLLPAGWGRQPVKRNTQVEKRLSRPEAKAAAAAISSFPFGSGGGEGGFAEATQQRLPNIFSDLLSRKKVFLHQKQMCNVGKKRKVKSFCENFVVHTMHSRKKNRNRRGKNERTTSHENGKRTVRETHVLLPLFPSSSAFTTATNSNCATINKGRNKG